LSYVTEIVDFQVLVEGFLRYYRLSIDSNISQKQMTVNRFERDRTRIGANLYANG